MLTIDQVRQAVAVLETEGVAVTMRTVRAKLGGYSMRDISKFYKQLRQPTNGVQHYTPTTAPEPAPAPPPAPEPVPVTDRASLEHYLGLALQRRKDLFEEREQLRARASWAFRTDEVTAFNRRSQAVNASLEQVDRDIAQYKSELSRLR